MPKVSVIMPVYNSEKSIQKSLSSVCNQSHKDLEIIIVYRKSDDKTLENIKKIKDSRIKIYEQKEKSGAGGARNIGLAKATGQWVGFVEADDFVEPDYFKKILKVAIKNKVDVAWASINCNGKKWVQYDKTKTFTSFKDKFSIVRNGASFDKLFRLNLIWKNNIKFAENILWEDNLFTFKSLYYADKIATVPNTYYEYCPSKKDEEYQNRLKKDVIPAAKEIVSFAETLPLTKQEHLLLYSKIVKSFAKGFMADKEIYRGLKELMNNPFFLKVMYWKACFKKFKYRILKRKESK